MEENNERFERNETIEEKIGEVVGADGFSENEKQDGKAMAILSYIGFLSLIPYLAEKNNKWVRFHAVQGVNLLIISLINGIIGMVPLIGWLASFVIGIIIIVLQIIGIVNACNGEAKELPIVENLKFIKQ